MLLTTSNGVPVNEVPDNETPKGKLPLINARLSTVFTGKEILRADFSSKVPKLCPVVTVQRLLIVTVFMVF